MGDLAQSVGGLVARVRQSERAAAVESHCPKETAIEKCDGGFHWGLIVDRYGAERNASRPCPMIQYSTQREQLADALELAGFRKGRDALIPSRCIRCCSPSGASQTRAGSRRTIQAPGKRYTARMSWPAWASAPATTC